MVVAWVIPIVIVGFLVLSPIIRLQVTAFQDGASAYGRLFSSPDLGRVLWNSFFLAVGSVVFAVVVGTGLAWYAYQLRPKLRWLSLVPILPLVLPPIASIIGWVFLLSPTVGYINTLLRFLPWWSGDRQGPLNVYSGWSIVLLTGINLTAFVYLYVITALRNMNAELYEAADVSGASGFMRFRAVVLPLLRPSIAYATVLVLLLGFGQFTAPLLLGRQQGFDVITTQMYKLIQQFPIDIGQAAAFGSPLIVAGALLLIAQRFTIGDSSRFVSQTGKQVRSMGGSSFAPVPIVVFGVIALLLPLLALIHVSLLPFWSGQFSLQNVTTANYALVFHSPQALNGILDSLGASAIAIAIVLPIAFTASMLLRRGSMGRRRKILLDVLVAVPLVTPAVVFGAGILFSYNSPPLQLYGTLAVIVIAYVTLMIPHATRMISSGVLTLGEQYFEAARVSGAGTLRTTFRISLPLLRPSLGGAVAIIFVLLTQEFAASLFVRSAGTNLMGTVIYDFWDAGTFPQVAALAIVMCVVTAVGVGLAFLLGGSRAFDQL